MRLGGLLVNIDQKPRMINVSHLIMNAITAGVAKLFGPRAIFRNFDEGAGHTTIWFIHSICILLNLWVLIP